MDKLITYTVKLRRRLDGNVFIRQAEAFTPEGAGFLFDTRYFEVTVIQPKGR